MNRLQFKVDDGGRAMAGYKGATGDCGTRAIAIALQLPYQHVYELVNEAAKLERPGAKRRGGRRSHARTGIFVDTMHRILAAAGWTFTATMGIGTGCKVHLRAGELPMGRLICRVSVHYVAVIDGVIHDTGNPDRGGNRCVYGYWSKA